MQTKRRLTRLFTGPVGLLFATVALAAVVTAAQVAEAIRNSPNASPWLVANADAVGDLAMFESGGRTDVFNGSCCSGVLQMNRENIARYARVSPEEFRTWSLQDQVNAWSQLTKEAMNNQIVRGFEAMGTFDGRAVDGSMVLACVQLGIGNCRTMIRSGSCHGFADINGTTICDMADRIAGRTPTGGATLPGQGFEPAPGAGAGGGGGGGTYTFECAKDSSGGCMSMSEAMREGFRTGSGVSMSDLRSTIQALMVAIALLIVGSALLGVWQHFAKGAIALSEMKLHMLRGLVIVGLVFVILSVL